jgi:hypothetical protein
MPTLSEHDHSSTLSFRSNHSRSNPGSTDNRQYRAVPCPTPYGALTNHKTKHGLVAAGRGAWV